MNLKTVKTEDAVSMVLTHDVAEIRQGGFKGHAFKRGPVIQPDLTAIARMGHRGLGLNCSECRFPIYPFGKAASQST